MAEATTDFGFFRGLPKCHLHGVCGDFEYAQADLVAIQ